MDAVSINGRKVRLGKDGPVGTIQGPLLINGQPNQFYVLVKVGGVKGSADHIIAIRDFVYGGTATLLPDDALADKIIDDFKKRGRGA